MKEFKKQSFFSLILWVCLGFVACKNTIMEKWWDTPQTTAPAKPAGPTQLYVDGTLKMEAKLPAIFAWIKSNIADNTHYIIRIGVDDSLLPEEGWLHYPNITGVTITLAGKEREQIVTITDNAKGSLFDVGANVTFVLSEKITLKGHSDNNNSLIMVSNGGTLMINDGATIRDNINMTDPSTDWRASGISVDGIFIMDGGVVSGNRCNNGGGGIGVLDGTFTMNGGSISSNEAEIDGGGVQVYRGTFIMNGGIISNNMVTTMNSGTWVVAGGGVYIGSNGGQFTKIGGIIYGSDAPDGLANRVLYYGIGGGAAVYANQSGTRVRNNTLYENDNISTANWNVGWE